MCSTGTARRSIGSTSGISAAVVGRSSASRAMASSRRRAPSPSTTITRNIERRSTWASLCFGGSGSERLPGWAREGANAIPRGLAWRSLPCASFVELLLRNRSPQRALAIGRRHGRGRLGRDEQLEGMERRNRVELPIEILAYLQATEVIDTVLGPTGGRLPLRIGGRLVFPGGRHLSGTGPDHVGRRTLGQPIRRCQVLDRHFHLCVVVAGELGLDLALRKRDFAVRIAAGRSKHHPQTKSIQERWRQWSARPRQWLCLHILESVSAWCSFQWLSQISGGAVSRTLVAT